MSFRRELRALRYIQRGDVLRLKSYLRKHRHLCLDQPLPDGQSLLHTACALQEDACVCLLLRKGANPLQSDTAGNNALHVAAREAEISGERVYTDLVVPILRRCPQALDAPNLQGITPRDILRRAEALMFDAPQNVSASRKQTCPPSPDMSDWKWKLMAESMDEYQEAFGQYEDDFLDPPPEIETFECWADRIFREHQARQHKSVHSGFRAQRAPANGTQRELEEQKFLERQQQMEKELRHSQRERYQKQCQEVFGSPGTSKDTGVNQGGSTGSSTEQKRGKTGDDCANIDNRTGTRLLGYNDIPWPVLGGTAEQMAQSIAAGANSSDTKTYKRYLRAQQVTWHPDRFLQRCGTRLLVEDRQRVLATVTALSQELNRLAERVK
ncbi:NF-kappa-B inhibitor-like protein 1 [Rhinophrynus dorsalis]